MRTLSALIAVLPAAWAMAQPPIDLQWSVIIPESNDAWSEPRISVDQNIVSWMLNDPNMQWSSLNGIVRNYLDDGTAITGYTPDIIFGCGSIGRPIDLTLRNDSLWGLSSWQSLAGDVLYCANAPGGQFQPDPTLNGDMLYDGAYDLLVGSSIWFISAWHQVSQSEVLSRIVALDLSSNVLWETDLPLPPPGAQRNLALRGDTLVLAAFPELYWLDAGTGDILGSTTVYTGGMGAGHVRWNGSAFLWAAHADGMLHYGKLDDLTVPVWSNSLPGSTVNGIAEDAQGRLWIGGNEGTSGMLTRVSSTGTVDGSWPQNASISDVVFHNGQLIWTGVLVTNAQDSYLVSGTPNP